MEDDHKLQWDNKYSVGVNEIDEQHKQLIDAINELIECIKKPKKDEVASIIKKIVKYKKEHFKTEEDYFKKTKYKGAEEHILEHKKFDAKISEIQAEYKEDLTLFAFNLLDFLEDWFIDHMMSMDQKYVPCFRDQKYCK